MTYSVNSSSYVAGIALAVAGVLAGGVSMSTVGSLKVGDVVFPGTSVILTQSASHLALSSAHEKFATDVDYQRFLDLASSWRKDRGISSSVSSMIISPFYQQIIGMGAKALPMLIRQLRAEHDDPDHWFWALRMITGEDPVDPADAGDPVRMAEAWLLWADRTHVG